MRLNYEKALALLAVTIFMPLSGLAQGPVFTVTPVSSSVTFNVKYSVSITGKFDKWDATLSFPHQMLRPAS